MPARAAVYRLLSEDPTLRALGVMDVFPAQSVNNPKNAQYYLVMRWEEVSRAANLASETEVLTVWAHMTRSDSADYAELVEILRRVREILEESFHVKGDDGVMTCVQYQGMSPDFDDPTLSTITKNVEYRVLSR